MKRKNKKKEKDTSNVDKRKRTTPKVSGLYKLDVGENGKIGHGYEQVG